MEPYLTYQRATAEGRLIASVPITVDAASMMHSFAITQSDVVWLDLPVDFVAGIAVTGQFPYRWNPDRGARIGTMDRSAESDTTRWFEIDPCYVFHAVNAHRTGAVVTLDALRYESIWTAGSSEEFTRPVPWRWELDLADGTVSERQLHDRHVELPTINRAVVR